MILTGLEIGRQVAAGTIIIDPYDPDNLEPNGYGFHLGEELITYDGAVLDCRSRPPAKPVRIPPEGMLLQPGRLYLGSTFERIGSRIHAATLYARRSTSTLGIWIQVSAPLGHAGAVIPWTLEMVAAHPVIVKPLMKIGKIAFWVPQGEVMSYAGKYDGSRGVVASRLSAELDDTPQKGAQP